MNNITKLLKEASEDDLSNIIGKIHCDDCPARNYCKTHEDTTCEETFREWCLMEEQDMETKAELIRENKYLSARNDYGLNARNGYPRIMDETDRQICDAFEAGKNWADENPKPGLVDIDKAVKWLEENTCDVSDTDDINHYMYMISSDVLSKEEFIKSFKLSMLEE